MAVPVQGPVEGADGTLAVYAINSFIVLFQKTQINLPWTRKNTTTTTTTTASIRSAFFFLSFSLVTVVEHAKGRVVTQCEGQSWIVDSTP